MVRVMALSDGYLTLFTIDPKTGKYIEYSSSDDFDSLGAKKDGNDFFGQAYVDAFTYCYEEDRQRFQEQVTQENVLRVIRERGNFSIDYRLIIRGNLVSRHKVLLLETVPHTLHPWDVTSQHQ